MLSKRLVILLVVACAVMFVTSVAMAQFLICLGKETHQGDSTVAQCVKEGHQFAYVDPMGVAEVLTKEELELTMAFYPKIGTMKAFSKQYAGQAERIAPLGPRLEP